MGRWLLVMVEAIAGATVTVVAVLVIFYFVVANDQVTVEENEKAICELAQVFYANTLNALARNLALAENADERETILASFDVSISRLEELRCNFTEVKP